jgi:uncharacterized SAM-binding protein YcdF (DUF218 family)
MFFELSKILGFLAAPSNALIVLGLLGVVLMATPLTRFGRRLAGWSLALIAIAGFSPLGDVLMLPLEERFPPWDASRGVPTGIVVLGGGIGPEVSGARGEAALNEAAERVTATVELARRYPDARIIYSGGSGALIYNEHLEADHAVTLLEKLGVPRARIIAENRSRNTIENARLAKALAQPKPGERWLLVTSAYHMPRAVGLFRAEGFAVEAYPVDWRTRGTIDLLRPFTTLGGGLQRTDTAMREWVGLVISRLTGRTADLLPGPKD